ncbi:hypothetical protein NE237_010119 [Protea cynaroides]|uniref:NB-ARC domain-containing protein n=1 Tax=Protea cynaroides TaxID=273540 RepID=A0A9Q0KZ58_9MAGN|nr:hypothetical protein NE237_010119 [Protea cynaroides]
MSLIPQLLEEFVTGKKFLLVLDDVWANHVYRLLLWIEKLQTGLKGSRILITTRSEKVAKQLGTAEPYLLQPLDKKAGWLLCESSAFWHKREEKYRFISDFKYLDHIEREIFKKTSGFPLFAKAWGRILLFEDTKEEWNSVMKLEIWDASNYTMEKLDQHNVWKDILRTLELSYVGLPPHLKRCFKYCSLFPKGCWMDKEMLTQLWMAEGFINHEDGDETKSEEIGGNYFDDLLSQTSFFKT